MAHKNANTELIKEAMEKFDWQRAYLNTSVSEKVVIFINNRNTITRCEICSKLTIKTPEGRQWRRPGVFIVNSEHFSHFVLVFRLLTLNR